VGLPGDEIAVQSNSLFVNGEQQTEPYLDPELMDEGFYGPTNTLPGHVFVMGNNRANSSNSRVFGPFQRKHRWQGLPALMATGQVRLSLALELGLRLRVTAWAVTFLRGASA
jgi:hypothetical protein